MIVLICGPSGVGKTTLISRLVDLSSFSVLMTATTRPNRTDGERWKMTTPRSEFDMKESRFYWLKPPIHGHLYAEYYLEVVLASCPLRQEVYLLDMGIIGFSIYQRLSYSIILMPESLKLLRNNLKACGREDRYDHAIDEFSQWEQMLEKGFPPRCLVLTAREGAEIELSLRAGTQIRAWLSEHHF